MSVPAVSLACSLVLPSVSTAQVVTNHPDDRKLVEEARSLLESSQYEKAIAAYKGLIDASNRTNFIYAAGAEAHVRIGECLYHLGRYEDAVKWFEEALAKFPRGSGRYDPVVKLGDTLVKLGRLDKAREAYRAASRDLTNALDIEERIKKVKEDSQPTVPP